MTMKLLWDILAARAINWHLGYGLGGYNTYIEDRITKQYPLFRYIEHKYYSGEVHAVYYYKVWPYDR